MTTKDIIDRLLRLMTMRSAMLELEWNTLNAKYDNALEKAFGSLDTAQAEAFIDIYRIGYVSASQRDALVAILSRKMPKQNREPVATTPSFDGTDDLGVTSSSRRGF